MSTREVNFPKRPEVSRQTLFWTTSMLLHEVYWKSELWMRERQGDRFPFLIAGWKFDKEREEMLCSIMEGWIKSKTIGSLKITRELWLGPKFSDKLNVEEDAKETKPLFHFIQDEKELKLFWWKTKDRVENWKIGPSDPWQYWGLLSLKT